MPAPAPAPAPLAISARMTLRTDVDLPVPLGPTMTAYLSTAEGHIINARSASTFGRSTDARASLVKPASQPATPPASKTPHMSATTAASRSVDQR